MLCVGYYYRLRSFSSKDGHSCPNSFRSCYIDPSMYFNMVLGEGFEPSLTANLANRGYKSRRATVTLSKDMIWILLSLLSPAISSSVPPVRHFILRCPVLVTLAHKTKNPIFLGTGFCIGTLSYINDLYRTPLVIADCSRFHCANAITPCPILDW